VIQSAEEFVELRTRNDPEATHGEALKGVWLAVIRRYPEFKEWVAHNKTVPVSVLKLLSQDPDAEVRYAVAMKRKCPLEVLESLAKDEVGSVRARVAWNASTPDSILESLLDDPVEEVAEAALARLESN
jgi:hypothetical protein